MNTTQTLTFQHEEIKYHNTPIKKTRDVSSILFPVFFFLFALLMFILTFQIIHSTPGDKHYYVMLKKYALIFTFPIIYAALAIIFLYIFILVKTYIITVTISTTILSFISLLICLIITNSKHIWICAGIPSCIVFILFVCFIYKTYNEFSMSILATYQSILTIKTCLFMISVSTSKIIILYGIYISILTASLYNMIYASGIFNALYTHKKQCDVSLFEICKYIPIYKSTILIILYCFNVFGILYMSGLLMAILYMYGATFYNQFSLSIYNNISPSFLTCNTAYRRIIRETEGITLYWNFGTVCLSEFMKIFSVCDFPRMPYTSNSYIGGILFSFILISNIMIKIAANSIGSSYAYAAIFNKGYKKSKKYSKDLFGYGGVCELRYSMVVDQLIFLMAVVLFGAISFIGNIIFYKHWDLNDNMNIYIIVFNIFLLGMGFVVAGMGSIIGGANKMQILLFLADSERFENGYRKFYLFAESIKYFKELQIAKEESKFGALRSADIKAHERKEVVENVHSSVI